MIETVSAPAVRTVVLARFNGAGTALSLLGPALVIGGMAWALANDTFSLAEASILVVIGWIFAFLKYRILLTAVLNLLVDRRALYVRGDRLIYVGPAGFGSFHMQAADIEAIGRAGVTVAGKSFPRLTIRACKVTQHLELTLLNAGAQQLTADLEAFRKGRLATYARSIVER